MRDASPTPEELQRIDRGETDYADVEWTLCEICNGSGESRDGKPCCACKGKGEIPTKLIVIIDDPITTSKEPSPELRSRINKWYKKIREIQNDQA